MWSRPASHQTPPSREPLSCAVMREAPWADPVEVASAFFDEIHACVLLSSADGWSYVLRWPDAVAERDELETLVGGGRAAVPGRGGRARGL